MSKEISKAVIKRMPKYYRCLGEMLENDIVRISSSELSIKMHITASQIRQDLNNFGGFGQQGYGYHVEHLFHEIGQILGLNKQFHMIIIGAGNLGQAIANYKSFERYGYLVKGIFDIDENLIGKTIQTNIIQSVDNLKSFLSAHSVQIAVLTVPKAVAPQIAANLAKWGVKAIWNFSPTELNVSENILVENVNLLDSLMTLSYSIEDKMKQVE